MYKSNRLNCIGFLPNVQLLTVFGNIFAAVACLAFSTAHLTPFSGAAAFAATKQAVSFGERPPGSPAIEHLRSWITSELKPLGGELSLDSFTAQTPIGPVPMSNIIVKFPGSSGKAIVVSGHYDTARIPMVKFVGANDAGSSTGFLIEFARAVSGMKHADDIYVVFFDGEEAAVRWTDTDSLYGSRQLAAKWAADGTLSKVKALINIDMVGDKDLIVADDENSSQSLREIMWRVADKLSDGKYFSRDPTALDDDHRPFVDAGVNTLEIITASPTLGAGGRYWHTAQDTIEKLSAHSFQVVGDVVIELLNEMEKG